MNAVVIMVSSSQLELKIVAKKAIAIMLATNVTFFPLPVGTVSKFDRRSLDE